MNPLSNVELHLVDNIDEAFKMLAWLGTVQRPELGIDTESTGLSHEKDFVRLIQIGDENTGWAIPYHQWGGVAADIIKRWPGGWILHNAPFDVGMLDKEGKEFELPRSKIKDTRPMAHVLDSRQSTALKNVAGRLVDPSALTMQADLNEAIGKKGGWTWATVPIHFQPYWAYGALDPVLTCRVHDAMWEQVQREALPAYELENAALWPVFNMERYGAHIDHAYAAAQLTAFNQICDEARAKCKELYGITPGSNPPIIEILQQAGFTFTERTASGALALTKDVLAPLDHPLAQLVLTYRQHQKMASTYLSHFVNDTDLDGLLHPDINTLGARTGRMSMRNPNLQNLPRANEKRPEATAIRNCITTRYGGDGSLVMCDFDQIEMRILAHVSQDAGMIEAFNDTSADFFVTLGRSIFNDPTMVKSDKRRQLVKNGGYAKIYGAGLAKFAQTAKVPVEVAREFLSRFDAMYPGGRNLSNAVQRAVAERQISEGEGYVRSPLTGRRHIADRGHEYALTNYMIQGAAAEVFKMKLLELDNAGLGKYMVAPVHDEIILDVPNDDLGHVVKTLKDVMNDKQLLSVPISASVSHGSRWGNKQPWPGESE